MSRTTNETSALISVFWGGAPERRHSDLWRSSAASPFSLRSGARRSQGRGKGLGPGECVCVGGGGGGQSDVVKKGSTKDKAL